MSETTVTSWTSDLTAAVIASARAKAESFNSHVSAASRQYVLAAVDAEVIYRHYLKGDKTRLTSFFADEIIGVKPSMAYVYVQAGRVYRQADKVGLTKEDCDGMAVQALAMFDRYLTSEDPKAEAAVLITADKALSDSAEAEGKVRKNLTRDGLQEVLAAAKAAEAGDTADPTDRKVGNIAGKLRDTLQAAIVQACTMEDRLAAGYAVAKWTAENGQYGPLTGQAVERLYIEAAAARKQADRQAAKAEAEAEAKAAEAAKVAAAVDQLKPAPRPKPAPKVSASSPKPAPKRTNRKPKNTGTAALVAANAPTDGK